MLRFEGGIGWVWADHNLAQGTSHTTSETSKKYLFVL